MRCELCEIEEKFYSVNDSNYPEVRIREKNLLEIKIPEPKKSEDWFGLIIHLNFCPLCGRKLKVKKDNGAMGRVKNFGMSKNIFKEFFTKNKKCNLCEKNKKLIVRVIFKDTIFELVQKNILKAEILIPEEKTINLKINYCPLCGRKLLQEKEKQIKII